MGGTKHDGDKVRMELVPPDVVRALAEVLTFGAKKYSQLSTEEMIIWTEKAFDVRIIPIAPPSAKGFAAHVTRNASANKIPIMPNANDKTVGTGTQKTLNDSKAISAADTKRRHCEHEMQRPNVDDYLNAEGSPRPTIKRCSTYKEEHVDFVDADAPDGISTTITRLGSLEGYCVLAAITVSGFSTTLWKALSALSPTFRKPLPVVSPDGKHRTGAWNWASGFDWGRLYGAAQRHLNAWWGGEGRDPETGLSHLAHALCCVAFLLVHELRGLGKDDRHVWPTDASDPLPNYPSGVRL